MEDVCVFDNAKERAELFQYLSELPVEYHKEYNHCMFTRERLEKCENQILHTSQLV